MNDIVTQPQGRSVIQDMADRFGMDKRAFEATLKATVIPSNVSNEQFAAFLLVAKQYNLNPITKEIYAFPAKGGGIQPIVGIDGWCNIINSHPQFDGMEFVDQMTDGKLTAITCKIHRKDRAHDISATEYMDECKKKTEPWEKWPARMLRHKALIQCARYAFGFSGIVDQDEAERMVDVTPTISDPVTGEIIETKESPFKKAVERKAFFTNVKESARVAQTLEELELIKTLNKPKLDLLKVSRSDHDVVGVEDLEQFFEIIQSRLLIATRETPEEDIGTFDQEEGMPLDEFKDGGRTGIAY